MVCIVGHGARQADISLVVLQERPRWPNKVFCVCPPLISLCLVLCCSFSDTPFGTVLRFDYALSGMMSDYVCVLASNLLVLLIRTQVILRFAFRCFVSHALCGRFSIWLSLPASVHSSAACCCSCCSWSSLIWPGSRAGTNKWSAVLLSLFVPEPHALYLRRVSLCKLGGSSGQPLHLLHTLCPRRLAVSDAVHQSRVLEPSSRAAFLALICICCRIC